ncbi:hypothetical protein WCLP8_3840006 [uncultured Gammaproteobacteria bacterium]
MVLPVMIVDWVWRLIPYLLLSTAVWVLVVSFVVLLSSSAALLSAMFWLRFIGSVLACYGSCVWIHRRHEES